MKLRSLAYFAVAWAMLGLVACDDDPVSADDDRDDVTENLVEVAAAAGTFGTLVGALDAAGLTSTLRDDGPFTVFAPDDDAFAAISDETLGTLVADTDRLSEVLTFHVVSGSFEATEVLARDAFTALNGGNLAVRQDGGDAFLNDARISATDIAASNGVIHVLETVMLPEGILTIVELARENGSFETLLAALDAAGLTETIATGGPFTVFAPTDDAFAALPEGALEGLLADPEALADVLTYHVVAGEVPASEVVSLDSAETLNGASVSITASDAGVEVNEANVIATDLAAFNGIVHVIDAVLLPPTS